MREAVFAPSELHSQSAGRFQATAPTSLRSDARFLADQQNYCSISRYMRQASHSLFSSQTGSRSIFIFLLWPEKVLDFRFSRSVPSLSTSQRFTPPIVDLLLSARQFLLLITVLLSSCHFCFSGTASAPISLLSLPTIDSILPDIVGWRVYLANRWPWVLATHHRR
jgi:hypothetical protein